MCRCLRVGVYETRHFFSEEGDHMILSFFFTAPPSSGHRNPPLTSRERVEKEVLLNVYVCIACVWLALVVFTSAMFSQTTLDRITSSQITLNPNHIQSNLTPCNQLTFS